MTELSNDVALIGPWVFEKIGKPWHPFGREALGLVRDGVPLAGVVFEDYTGSAVSLHVVIEDKHVPVRQLFIAVAEYAFNQLGVKKVLGLVPSTNLAALSLDIRLGFEPEAVIKDVYPDADLVVLSLPRDKCRWLRRAGVPHGKERQDPEAA